MIVFSSYNPFDGIPTGNQSGGIGSDPQVPGEFLRVQAVNDPGNQNHCHKGSGKIPVWGIHLTEVYSIVAWIADLPESLWSPRNFLIPSLISR
jgi:hypothetical protein